MGPATIITDDHALEAKIDSLVDQLAGTAAGPVANIIYHVCTGMSKPFGGTALEEVLDEGNLPRVYEYLGHLERKDFIRHLMHSKPNLPILEIGTNQGVSLHREMIKELTRPDGEILCAEYTLTTPGYLAAEAQEKLFPNMEYATLNISQDPFEQGFEETKYDFIIAVNALHETKDFQQSLVNISKLLRPDGRLLLQELHPSFT